MKQFGFRFIGIRVEINQFLDSGSFGF